MRNQLPTRSHKVTKNDLNMSFGLDFVINSNFGFLRIFVASCWFLVLAGVAFAQEATPSAKNETADTEAVSQAEPEKIPEAELGRLSKPEPAPNEAPLQLQAPGPGQVPSQGEGEKAPVSSKSVSVPEFSLPEVVITGENELTIGASRLDRRENDVTLGSHDLTGVERGLNDLPGLNKTMTALSTEEAGPSQDSAMILHLGGGVPGTYGGWGLLGHDFKDVQALLSGYYSTWAGETSSPGLDGDQMAGGNLGLRLFPEDKLNFRLGAGYDYNEANLPYQGNLSETRQGMDLSAEAQLKNTELSETTLKVTYQTTQLNAWEQGLQGSTAQELETKAQWSVENPAPFLGMLSLNGGWRHAMSNFPTTVTGSYDWEWATLKTSVVSGENLSLNLQAQAQGGDGLNLPLRVYPVADLMWRVFGTSQLDVYWRSDRFVDQFHNTYMSQEHIAPDTGFPSPTEVASEWGARLTQKLNERIILSLSASTAQINEYHQWNDLNDAMPTFIQDYASVSQVQLKKAGVNLQWDFARYWQVSGLYEYAQADNTGGDGLNITELPQNRGVLSLYRGNDTWEGRLEWVMVSSVNAFASTAGTLPAYNTLNLSATYHLSKLFSLWLQGENLLGENYQIQPNYVEPQYHIRGGVELIF